ncbi:hypothetical protein H0A58_13380, partial [Alcaligenaceae bacterium]|nr:hypothetical protein [Alcaligenaceae bacterium]
KVDALVVLGATVKAGDTLVVTADGVTAPLFDRVLTDADIAAGQITVQVPVGSEDTSVKVTATVTDPAGNSGSDDDTKGIDGVVPSVTVELQNAGTDNVYNAEEIGDDGKVDALVVLGATVKAGDTLVVTADGVTAPLFDRVLTDADIAAGQITVQVPVGSEDTSVKVTATVTDPAGNSGSDDDTKGIDGV